MAASWYAPQQNDSGYLRRARGERGGTRLDVSRGRDGGFRRRRGGVAAATRETRRERGEERHRRERRATRVPREENARGVSVDAQQAVREPLLGLFRVDADGEGEHRGVGPAVRLLGVCAALVGELEAVGPAPRTERRCHARPRHHRTHERARARGADDPLGQPRAPRVRRQSYGEPREDCGVGPSNLGRRREGGALHEAPDEKQDARGDARRALRRGRGARRRKRPRVRERSFVEHGARCRE